MILPKVPRAAIPSARVPGHAGSSRVLVLEDQRLRNDFCWSVFDC